MTALIFKLLLVIALVITSKFLRKKADATLNDKEIDTEDRGPVSKLWKLGAMSSVALSVFVALWMVLGTSMVWVSQGHFMTLKRTYFGDYSSLVRSSLWMDNSARKPKSCSPDSISSLSSP